LFDPLGMKVALWIVRVATLLTFVGSIAVGIWFAITATSLQVRIMGPISCFTLAAICGVFVWNDYKKIKSSS
jgi:hypothetical protein